MLQYLPLARIDEDIIFFVLMGGMFVVLPVVAMLLRHQKNMAELIHRNQHSVDQESQQRISQLENEVAHLRQITHDQIIRSDRDSE
jgi:selenocysteine lyase/cysteine desulfurase